MAGPKFKTDDVVQFPGRGRARNILAVVVKSRLVRARKRAWYYRYTLAPLNDPKEGRWWEAEERILKAAPADKVPQERRAAVVAEQRKLETERDQNRAGRAEDGRCALRDLGIEPGVVVVIKGRNRGDWRATVAKVNYKTGKFGIERSVGAVMRSESRAMLMNLAGRQGSVRRYRWIHANAVRRVVRD
jgi:hypothetical protein